MSDQTTFDLTESFEPVTYDQWLAVVEKDLKGAPFEKKLVTRTYEDIAIAPLYTERDWSGEGDPSGFPGFLPTTRAARALGNAVCGWDIQQEHKHPDPATTNAAILTDLQRGCTSIAIQFDAAGRAGLDPTDATGRRLAGREGVMIYRHTDLQSALAGMHLAAAGVSIYPGAAMLGGAAMLIHQWNQSSANMKDVAGAFNADPLGVLARSGSLPGSIGQAMQQMVALAQWANKHTQFVTAAQVDTSIYHEAGAHAAQDLAFSMATGLSYLRAMVDAGMSVDDAAAQIRFSFSLGCNFFLATAKLRAARKLWAGILKQCGAANPQERMKIHARTSRRVMTQRDPWVNLLRNTVCNFAGAVGTADVITTEPYDAAIGLPDDLGRRIARNTQVILQEESHLNRVIDPAGGCWFIEKMTDDLTTKTWPILQAIESAGGMYAALENGWVGHQIEEALEPRIKNLEKRKDPITGVSEFPNLGEKDVARREPNYDALADAAIERLQSASPDASVQVLLKRITEAARSSEPGVMVDLAVQAVGQGATLGQVVAAVQGDAEAVTVTPLTPHPYAQSFEELRDASDQYKAQCGQRPQIFLANMGPVAQHIARATYSRNFFEAGGFEVLTNNGFETSEQAASAFGETDANIAVICSSDKLYATMVEQVAPALKQAGAKSVVLAGNPGEHEAKYREAGVDMFIHIGCNVLQTLRTLLQQEQVIE